MLPASGAADVPMPTPVITQNANGSITISVTVPPSTPPGVYLIAIVGTTPSGASRAIIVPVVVRRQRAASVAAAAAAPAVALSLPADVRAQLKALQDDIDAAGGAEAIEDAVLEDGATLSLEGAQLLVNGRPLVPTDDGDANRPLVAAAAVALGGASLVLLRRRTPVISRRTK